MADISRIVDLYDLYKSYRRVARELRISRNTVKKYVLKVKEVQDGLADEILPKNRGIIQPLRVLTEPVRQNIHEHLESNLSRPKKQRITAKRIWELLIEEGHRIGYSSVKTEVARWKRTNVPREVFILQEPRVGVNGNSKIPSYGNEISPGILKTFPFCCSGLIMHLGSI